MTVIGGREYENVVMDGQTAVNTLFDMYDAVGTVAQESNAEGVNEQQHEDHENQDEEQVVEKDELRSDGDEYFIHIVSPADTLGGLELRYGVSSSVIRQINGMTSDRLTSHLQLKIPKNGGTSATYLKPTLYADKKTEKLQKLRLFRLHICHQLTMQEVDYYIKQHEGDLKAALRACKRDFEWEKKHATILKTRSLRVSESTVRRKNPFTSKLRSWWSGGSSSRGVNSSSPKAPPSTKVAEEYEGPTLNELEMNVELIMMYGSGPADSSGLDDGSTLSSPLLLNEYKQL